MRPLSASEAIGPALNRTADLLFRPFRFRTFFKIAAVAFFAGVGSGFNSSSFNHRSGGVHSLPPAVLAFIVAFAVIIGLISLVVYLILLYVGSRLQLVLVEMVATRQTFVAPLWRKYGDTVWRWIGLKLLFFLCILLVTLPLTVPMVLFFVHHGMHGNLFSGLHIVQIIFFIAAALVVLLALSAVYMLVRDLALPYIALENRGIADSLGRLRTMISFEPGQIVLYVFLRMVLGFVFGMAAEIAIFFILLLSLIPPGILAVILWLALHKAGPAGYALLIALAVAGGVLFFCWALCVIICLVGSVLVFSQAYALYFLGGRYPLLGELLDRSTPPPEYTYGYPPQPSAPLLPAASADQSMSRYRCTCLPNCIAATWPLELTYTVAESAGLVRPWFIDVSYINRRSRKLTAVHSGAPGAASGSAAGPMSATSGQLDQSRYTSPSQLRLAASVAGVSAGL